MQNVLLVRLVEVEAVLILVHQTSHVAIQPFVLLIIIGQLAPVLLALKEIHTGNGCLAGGSAHT